MGVAGKVLIGVAALLNVVALLAGSLPEPYNYVVIVAVILIIIGVIFEAMDWM